MTARSVSSRTHWYSAAWAFAFSASALGLVSIAASHACLAIALACLLASRERWRLPAVAIPLGAFLAWTLVSTAASPEPGAALPQIKKFFVFLFLPILYTLFRRHGDARQLAQAWFVVAGVAVTVAYVQFVQRAAAARASSQGFLASYANDRITGFFSHWMTFSETGLLIFLVLASFLLFSRQSSRGRVFWVILAGLIGLGLVLSFTRSVWLALGVVGIYLAWHWDRRWLWAIPVAAALVLTVAPESIQERVRSIGSAEQNQNRLVMWRIGVNMIQAHPIFGVGPERVGPLVPAYQPEDVKELPEAYWGHLHNIYIHYGAERGLPAVAALLAFLLKILWDLRRALRRAGSDPGDVRFLLHGGIAATLAVMIVGCFDLTLGDSEILGAYLGIVALAYAAADEAGAHESREDAHVV